MLTFQDARAAAMKVGAEEFRVAGYAGTYYAREDGFELGDIYVILDGAREYLLDGDESYEILDKPLTVVDRIDGAVRYLPVLDNFEILDRMIPANEASPPPTPAAEPAL